MRITASGIYRDFPTADYFADPCPEPSFTQSLAKILIEQSALHAYHAHPRLNVLTTDEDDEKYDKAKAIGNAAHALMLGRGKALAVEDFPDWRTKDAKAFKAAALEAGKEPVLQIHYDIAIQMVKRAHEQLRHIPGCGHIGDPIQGDAEVVIASCEDGLWLRAMIDWITPDLRQVVDFKTSGMSVSPYATGRLMASAGWHIQAAMHERILDEIDPDGAGRRHHLYVAQENYEPFALTVNEIDEAALTIGRKQLSYAIDTWAICMCRDQWPAYPTHIIRPELPGWHENGWLAREVAEESERVPSFMGG
jgi:PDDEXK-like domain of unknown function (DUF3799)